MHLNFNGTCHGGALFALADSAFGLASNSHGPVAAGIDAHVAYHRPARLGERLEARATEASRGARVATYRVDVRARERARRLVHRDRLPERPSTALNRRRPARGAGTCRKTLHAVLDFRDRPRGAAVERAAVDARRAAYNDDMSKAREG